MGAVYFYHLTQRPLEATLPVLLERSLQQGWRVELRGQDPERLDWLDQKLWLGADDSFLPHGKAGGPQDDDQPILLSTTPLGGRACLMCVDGAAPSVEEVSACERVCILFDGQDSDAVQAARVHWKTLTDAGCAAQYWSEEGGRWEKKAETQASET